MFFDNDTNEYKYRQYLKDVADDENFDLNALENYKEWCAEEADRLKELNEEVTE